MERINKMTHLHTKMGEQFPHDSGFRRGRKRIGSDNKEEPTYLLAGAKNIPDNRSLYKEKIS